MVKDRDLFDMYATLRRSVALKANGIFKEIGLGSRQFIILWSLSRRHLMSVGELVEAAMTDAATVSRSLAQLEKNGYIEKVQCKKDGRVWYVKLTKKGMDLAPQMERLYARLARQCFAILKPNERTQLASLLGKVIENLSVETRNELSVEA
jgi:DNA-binding MarR family transcriptional regulator